MGVFIETDGAVKSCCAGGYYWGNLNEQSLEDIITSPQVIELKQKIIDNQPVDYCKGCRRDEDATGYSLRNYYDQFTADSEVLNKSHSFILRNIDIRWNALCNLNCAYCNERSSTRWQGLKNLPIESLERQYYDEVLDFIAKHSEELEIILLVGGEPLLPRQNRTLLENVPDNVHIDIISNLAANLDNNQVFAKIRNKTDVGWKVSFETLGAKFAYVRHGADWHTFKKNLHTVKQLAGHNITALPVYCIYSATNLVEFYEFAHQENIDVHWQTLWGPDYLSVVNFSADIRKLAVEEIDRALALPYIDKFNNGLNRVFLETQKSELLASTAPGCNQEFRNWTQEYETKYATDTVNFATLWPELWRAL